METRYTRAPDPTPDQIAELKAVIRRENELSGRDAVKGNSNRSSPSPRARPLATTPELRLAIASTYDDR